MGKVTTSDDPSVENFWAGVVKDMEDIQNAREQKKQSH